MPLENFQKIPVKGKYDSLKGEKVNINYKELVMQFLCGDGKITNFNNNIQVTALMCTQEDHKEGIYQKKKIK